MDYCCDPTLLAEVRKYGKFDVAGCFNCGSCTLSCDLAGDHVSFPRRSTRHVLMGLRQVLNEGLDPWICHDCGDCSTVCPRQTEPREAMMTLGVTWLRYMTGPGSPRRSTARRYGISVLFLSWGFWSYCSSFCIMFMW